MSSAPNAIFTGSLQTLQITTGNVLTVNDSFNAALYNNNAKNPLGQVAYISDGTVSGRRWRVRYVRMNATTFNPTPVVGPVYWKDNTFQVVTTLASEAPMGVNGVAGILLNPNVTNGNFCFVLTSGFLGAANLGASIPVPVSTAAGDLLIGATGQQTLAREAAGSTRTNVEVGIAQTAVSGGLGDIFVNMEN